MILAVRAILIGYVVLWLVLLAGCLCKREFCPVFADSRKTRWFWLATFVLFNPVLTVLYLFFGQLRSPAAKPIRAVRDIVFVVAIAGFFLNIPGLTHLWMQPLMGRAASADETIEDPKFQAKAAVIEAANNTSSSSVVSSTGNSRLACRHVAVVVEGDHPLLGRVGSTLAKQLEAIDTVDTVELCGNGIFPEAGQRTPDVFVRLDLGRIQETSLPYSLKLQAQIGANVGQSPLRSNHHYGDTFSPPVLDYGLNLDLTHTSTTTGYESVRYSMAAENIAKALAEQIGKFFEQWSEKHGLLPELPAEFYGDYVACDLPEPLAPFEPDMFGSYAGLLTHNETYWQFTVTGDPCEPLQSVRDAMVDSGWKEMTSDWGHSNINLRMARDDRLVQIFQIPQRTPMGRTVVISYSSGPEPEPTHLFGVTDTQKFSADERRVALDGLLTEPYSLEHLIIFEPMFDKSQRERWLKVLESLPVRDAYAQIRLGELYQQRDMPEKSAEALRLARALLWAERDQSQYQSRLKSLAKRLGDEELAKVTPTRQDFLDAGFAEITSGMDSYETEANPGEPILTFCEAAQGEPVVLVLEILGSGSDADPYHLQHLERQGGMCSYGTQGGFSRRGGLWQDESHQAIDETSVIFKITQIEGQDRFKISATIDRSAGMQPLTPQSP